MGVGEQYSACGQPVDIRGQCLWMSLQATNPVIQIIDGNEKHMRLVRGSKRRRTQYQGQQYRNRLLIHVGFVGVFGVRVFGVREFSPEPLKA